MKVCFFVILVYALSSIYIPTFYFSVLRSTVFIVLLKVFYSSSISSSASSPSTSSSISLAVVSMEDTDVISISIDRVSCLKFFSIDIYPKRYSVAGTFSGSFACCAIHRSTMSRSSEEVIFQKRRVTSITESLFHCLKSLSPSAIVLLRARLQDTLSISASGDFEDTFVSAYIRSRYSIVSRLCSWECRQELCIFHSLLICFRSVSRYFLASS